MVDRIKVSEELRRRAYDVVKRHYAVAAQMKHVSLDRVNRPRPKTLRYRSVEDLVRHQLAMAGAVSTFAVEVGLITSDDALRLILDFDAAHPEVTGEE